ncbi:MAG TPA: hypothetical protein VL551_22185 [Actinospica sp.]|jgi:hypothetical protein|nr:hypothetical protein [Actinospica sp.]
MSGFSGRARIWFAALLRSATVLVLTLVVLAILGGVTDIVLHETRHTSTNTASYSGIRAVDIVLDGDISLTVLGKSGNQTGVVLNAVDTSTPFDDPVRMTTVIGGTLYLTERCPDSRCTAELTLMLDASDQVDVVAGNALRIDQAVIDFNGMTGKATVQAAPGKLIVTNTVVTGAVMGQVECDKFADCSGVATSSAASPTR